MADRDPTLFEQIEEVVPPAGSVLGAGGRFLQSWWKWFWGFRQDVNENSQSTAVSDTSYSDPGRIAALEERVRQVEEAESRLLAVAAQAQQDIAVIAAASVPPQDALPAHEAPVAAQAIDVVAAEQLAARVAALESNAAAPQAAAQAEQQMQVIAEAVVAEVLARAPAVEPAPIDALDGAPAVELGQLFKARTYTQWVAPTDMYLPTTQPAIGPTMYETVVGGSAFLCWECAPGTLAADNDNVLFMISPPEGWNGQPVRVRIIWTHAATVTNFLVAWCANAQQYTDGGSGAAAFSADTVVQDVGGTTNAIYTSIPMVVIPANAGAAPANPQYPVLFKVKRRNQSEGAVGLAVNARVVGVHVIWDLYSVAQT